MNAHRLFPEAAWTIYLDGQLVLTCDPLVILDECEETERADLYVVRHDERDCIFEEIDAIARLGRDQPSHMAKQATRYREMGFDVHSGLYLGGLLIRRGGNACQAFNEMWWQEVVSGSHRDQISLPVAIRESGISFAVLPASSCERFCRRQPHARTNGHAMKRLVVRRRG